MSPPSGPGLWTIADTPFEALFRILPERDSEGQIVVYSPQSRYANCGGIPLHQYGQGPFCRFRLPPDCPRSAGVYVIVVNGRPSYVGECEDLAGRFNNGYGNISPRNCFVGGQPTNCKVNSLVLQEAIRGSNIDLLFHVTADRFANESKLIEEVRPPWNATAGRRSGATTTAPTRRRVQHRRPRMGKYDRLGNFLEAQSESLVNLSYAKIEAILDASLPPSAYEHRPWWANGGHTQADSWLRVGWEVDTVELGREVTFRRASAGRKPGQTQASQTSEKRETSDTPTSPQRYPDAH